MPPELQTYIFLLMYNTDDDADPDYPEHRNLRKLHSTGFFLLLDKL